MASALAERSVGRLARAFQALRRGAPTASPRETSDSLTSAISQFLGHRTSDVDPLPDRKNQLKATAGWIFSCVSMIADDVAGAPFGIFDKTTGDKPEEWERLPDQQVEAQSGGLLRQPNSRQTWGELTELTQWQLDLTGECWLYIVSAVPGEGQALGIQWLSPDWIKKPVYDSTPQRNLTHWKVQIPGQGVPLTIDARDIVPILYSDPNSSTRGMSPLRQMATSYHTDLYARAYTADFLKHGAFPSGLLSTKEPKLSRVRRKAIQEAWMDANRGKQDVAVLSDGAMYQPIGSMLKQLEMMDLSRVSRDMILGAYKIPASRLGLQEDANRATGIEADRTYHAQAVNPRLRRRGRVLSAHLLPRMGWDPARWELRYEEQNIRDQMVVAGIADNAVNAGTITLDQHRAAAMGLEPLEGGKGEVYKVSAGTRWVKDPAEGGFAPFQALPTPAAGPEPEPEPPPPEGEGEEEDERARRLVASAHLLVERLESAEPEPDPEPELNEDRIKLAVAVFLRIQGELEHKMLNKLRSIYTREGKAVAKEIRAGGTISTKARDGTRPTLAQSVEAATRGAIDDVLASFEDDWGQAVGSFARSSYEEGFDLFAEQQGVGLDFEVVREQAVAYAETQAAEYVKGALDTTKEAVRGVIKEGLDSGANVDDMAKDILELYDGWKSKGNRAEMAARTETAGAVNAGQYDHAVAFDDEDDEVSTTKTWLPTQDDRTRLHHRASAIRPSQTISVTNDFEVDGFPMARPLDSRGEAGNVINCRCTLTFDITEG